MEAQKKETRTPEQEAIAKLAAEKFPNLKNLEKEHGALTAIAVEGKIGLFKKPSRQVVSMATALKGTDPIKYLETIADNCFVDGDRELLEVDEYFYGIMPLLNHLVEVKSAELVKL